MAETLYDQVDQYGVIETEKTPDPRGLVQTRSRNYEVLISSTLTAQTVIQYLTSAERGSLRHQMEMFDRMIERDPHLASVLQTRRMALTQAERDVIPADETDSRAVDAAGMIRDELSGLEDWDDHIEVLLDAVPKGIQLEEILYTDDWGLSGLVEIPSKLLDWTDPAALKVHYDGLERPSEPLIANKFIRHSPRLRSGTPVRRGLMRTLSILWCISHYALEDWAGYAEVFGMPLRLGKYDPATVGKSDDLKILVAALKQIGSDASGVIPKTMDIEFVEPQSRVSSSGTLPAEQLIKHCEKKMSIAVLGQHLTTQAESGTGTLAGNAQDQVRRDIARADARQFNTTIRRDLFRQITLFRMGPETPVPLHWFGLADPVDEETRAKVFQIAHDFGQPISMAQVRKELGLEEPTDPGDVLPPASSSQPFGGMLSAMRTGKLAAGTNLPAGSAQRANHKLAAAAAEGQSEALSQVVDLVLSLAERVSTPEQLLARIQLAAPDLENLLSDAGMSFEEFQDLAGRSMAAADFNARSAVRAEREV